jgi:hypothetical protein
MPRKAATACHHAGYYQPDSFQQVYYITITQVIGYNL